MGNLYTNLANGLNESPTVMVGDKTRQDNKTKQNNSVKIVAH